MGANTQTTAQNQAQQTSPWAPAIPGLTNIINQLSSGGAPLTPGQGAAVGALQTAAGALPGFGPAASNAVGNLFGSTPGLWTNAYNTFSNTLAPYLNPSSTNPLTAPGVGTALNTVNEDITNQVKGMFAAAGRDPTGNAAASKALARGLAQGEAPIITNEYNTLAGQQLGAANSLLGGAGSTASGLSGLTLQGIQGAGAIPGLWTAPATTQLQAANIGQQLPYENLQLPADMLGRIASLGGQGINQGTSTVTQPVNPWTTAAGIGLGLWGLSDRRLKEDVEPIGLLFNGLPFYKFRFKGSPKVEIGVMAQDVEKVMPEAVIDIGLWRGGPSVKAVNYDKATSPMAMAA